MEIPSKISLLACDFGNQTIWLFCGLKQMGKTYLLKKTQERWSDLSKKEHDYFSQVDGTVEEINKLIKKGKYCGDGVYSIQEDKKEKIYEKAKELDYILKILQT